MTTTTESSTFATATPTPAVVRRGRVWKGPRPETSKAANRPPRGSYLAVAATVSMIAAGAVAMAHLDNGPASATEAVAVDDLSLGSMYRVVDQIGARSLWDQGFTGTGVNVAVIDTGVAAVEPLTAPGKLAAVVDLSSEQSDPSTAHVDSFGHGTHIAGIIAGRQPGSDPAQSADHPEWFMGVAPDAGIVSVKVAGRDGEVSLASLVTGIDWVVAHADELDIRVLNLAFNGNVGESYLDGSDRRRRRAGVERRNRRGHGGRQQRRRRRRAGNARDRSLRDRRRWPRDHRRRCRDADVGEQR